MSLTDPCSASTPLTETSHDDASAATERDAMAAAVERAEGRLRIMRELTEMGMDITRVLHEQVLTKATEPDKPPAGGDAQSKAEPQLRPQPDPAVSFAKLSRAIRLTLDLEARADEALRALIAGEVTAREARREAGKRRAEKAGAAREQAAIDRVEKQVRVAIARESESEAAEDALYEALEERLSHDVAYILAGQRPLRQVVEQLCGELGLTPDWSGWTEGEGWPDPKDAPPYRSRWSVFNEVSRTPLLE